MYFLLPPAVSHLNASTRKAAHECIGAPSAIDCPAWYQQSLFKFGGSFGLSIISVLSISTGEGWDIGRELIYVEFQNTSETQTFNVDFWPALYFCSFLVLSRCFACLFSIYDRRGM